MISRVDPLSLRTRQTAVTIFLKNGPRSCRVGTMNTGRSSALPSPSSPWSCSAPSSQPSPFRPGPSRRRKAATRLRARARENPPAREKIAVVLCLFRSLRAFIADRHRPDTLCDVPGRSIVTARMASATCPDGRSSPPGWPLRRARMVDRHRPDTARDVVPRSIVTARMLFATYPCGRSSPSG
jgi:hypothetical protein